ILLLPRANNNWKADVYTWKFFSLYPLLADISRQPFLYNNDSLTDNESALVNQLYDSILAKNNRNIYIVSDILRIKFLIVRNDFNYNLNWSITESPKLYTDAIQNNPIFVHRTTFGKWDIYELKRDYDISHASMYTVTSTYNGDGYFSDAVKSLLQYLNNEN